MPASLPRPHCRVLPARAPGAPLPAAILRALPVLASLLLPACSPPPPGAEEAARALLASDAFRMARFETLPPAAAGRCPEVLGGQPEWNRWIGLGIARAAEIVTSSGPLCRLVADEAIRREAENWRHRIPVPAAGDEDRVVLPVAVRSLLRVNEIRSVGRGVAEATFEWHWRLNQLGQRLGIDTSPRRGWSQLVLDDSGWRASRVEAGQE